MTRKWQLAHGRSLNLGATSLIMGILNITPDSFSDPGKNFDPVHAVTEAQRMQRAGAAIIDVGGESTKPNAAPVSAEEEQARILPVITALAQHTDCVISVDTYRADTAKLAIDAGAHIVNDVWGLQREPDIAQLAAKTGAGLVIMHTGRERTVLPDVIEDQYAFLRKSLAIADQAGVDPAQIMLDPGFGFAKDAEENVALIARFKELSKFNLPFLVGTSRKRFIGAVTGHDDMEQRDVATAATSALLRIYGASVFRVHNVEINRDALAMADAVVQSATLAS